MDRLKGKTAIISGGATGMGAAAARLFAAEGATVGVIDRNVAAGEALVADLKAAGPTYRRRPRSRRRLLR